ncbi:hypothetical protein FQN52_003900 [Onygenales sp. PD_12]|nr:hypothetical protein FQN52_003900 [Onygenales sp. PD_12]
MSRYQHISSLHQPNPVVKPFALAQVIKARETPESTPERANAHFKKIFNSSAPSINGTNPLTQETMFNPFSTKGYPTTGALSLTGLETLSDEAKTEKIAAVVNDITASIIYIAKQGEAGNLTTDQVAPIYNLVGKMNLTANRHNKSLLKELEQQDIELEGQGQQIERMAEELEKRDRHLEEVEGQHRSEMQKLKARTNATIGELKGRAERLEAELRELRQQKRAIEVRDRKVKVM